MLNASVPKFVERRKEIHRILEHTPRFLTLRQRSTLGQENGCPGVTRAHCTSRNPCWTKNFPSHPTVPPHLQFIWDAPTDVLVSAIAAVGKHQRLALSTRNKREGTPLEELIHTSERVHSSGLVSVQVRGHPCHTCDASRRHMVTQCV